MADSLWSDTAEGLLERTASADPTPGGGSVGMLAGSFGLALVLMALEVTRKRKDAPEGIDALLAEGCPLLEAARRSADADVEVFDAFMAAMRLPRQSDEEKARRRAAMQEATVKATEAPLEAAALCLAALDLASRAAGLTHPNILSDVSAGAVLLGAAGRAVLVNVDANLGTLKDAERKQRYASQRAECESSLRDAEAGVLRRIAERGSA
jgi:formiminotetrahydrofolate cyclodeaminase